MKKKIFLTLVTIFTILCVCVSCKGNDTSESLAAPPAEEQNEDTAGEATNEKAQESMTPTSMTPIPPVDEEKNAKAKAFLITNYGIPGEAVDNIYCSMFIEDYLIGHWNEDISDYEFGEYGKGEEAYTNDEIIAILNDQYFYYNLTDGVFAETDKQ